ncbi:MAG: hypothetical protein IKT32_06375 [Clostridia bacterium]|nr:hypothetical protein [Clostridia bacterium]
MIKTLFTRKNLIAISLVVFYAFIFLFTGICLDGNSSMVSSKNPIAKTAKDLGFQLIDSSLSAFVCLILIAVYIIVFAVAFVYERRYAIVNNKSPKSLKMIGTYILTALACAILSLGLGILIQKPLSAENIGNLIKYLTQTFVMATCIYVLLFAIIGALLMFVINFIFVDKPFKFFGKEEEPVFDDDEFVIDNDVTAAFDADESHASADGAGGAGGVGGGAGGGSGAGGETIVQNATELDDREKVFPSLSRIDNEFAGLEAEPIVSDDLTLEELANRFRNYLAEVEKLYFDIDTIRFFISGFAASHFEILEGLSGTGKSSLPRYFAKFVNGRALFMPVQATWRDKTNILGFFNEFTQTYSETDFLIEIYRANYNPDLIHIFVLDEMNISRVEYYFADLLSVLEYPEDEWLLKVMTVPYNFMPPVKLEDGTVRIPVNAYFVGTANKDDSTFTITDKVYDRAITTEFDYKNDSFTVDGAYEPVMLTHSKLTSLYDSALNNPEFKLNKEDYDKLNAIGEFVYDQFGIAIGNRILTQIDNIVPVFVASGGTKETAIDFMISKKLVSKIEGRFEEYVKTALKQLLDLIAKTYGEKVLPKTEKVINNILRTL